jgi:VRR-NUC domain
MEAAELMARISVVTRSGRKLSPGQLLEKEVTQQVKDFLAYRGWRPIRMMRTAVPGSFSVGEPGMPDFLFCRYLDKPMGACLALWIEMKRPGGKLRDGQPEWHARERARGATVWVVDDFDFFANLYEKHFGWLHSGDAAIGQLDLLAALRGRQ